MVADRKIDSLIVFGLLSNEHRMSVMHLVMKRAPGFTEEIKSKSQFYFSCGFRRFTACPIFSQHTNSDKVFHKNDFEQEITGRGGYKVQKGSLYIYIGPLNREKK